MAHSSRMDSIMAGKLRQESEVAGHIASIVRKYRGVDIAAQPAFSLLGPSPWNGALNRVGLLSVNFI